MEGINEEIETLKSIFVTEVEVRVDSKGITEVVFSCGTSNVILTLTSSYPDELPIITTSSELQALGLQNHLITTATPLRGTPMLYAILDAAKDWFESNSSVVVSRDASLKRDVVCKYYMQGKCRFGIHCINLHPGAVQQPVSQSSTQIESQTNSKSRPDSSTKNESQSRNKSTESKTQQQKEMDEQTSLKKSPKGPKQTDEDEKKEKMRTATEVISRILWDPDLPTADFSVGYLDRFTGIQEKAFTDFSWENIASVGGDVLAVPKHRIQYFKYKERIVWDKRNQSDDFFGSRGGKTIDQIVEKSDTSAIDSKEQEEKEGDEGMEVSLLDHEVEEEENDDRPLAHRHSDQNRPTHFICIHVSNEEVKSCVGKVTQHITQLNPQLAEGIINIPALHVTLCMLRLTDEAQIETAKRVLESCRLQFISVLPRCVKLSFTGVDNFRERLIYVKVKPLPALTKFVSHLIEQFQQAGIKTPGNRDEYTPHITIVKLSRPMQRELNSQFINPACYKPYLNKQLGSQPVTGIHLCAMHAPAQPDGFYLRHSTITNSLLGLPESFASLVEQKINQFKEMGYLSEYEQEQLVGDLQTAVNEKNENMFECVIEEIMRVIKEVATFESKSSSQPSVVIMRGLPGSGKSYLATHCQEVLENPAQTVVVSADDYFSDGSEYKFDPVVAFKAHQHCLIKFLEALAGGKKLVIIDNTNSQMWEYRIYTFLCEVLGYRCHVLEIPCPSPALAERFRCRNQHNIQRPAITKMMQRWEEDDRAVYVPPSLAYPKDWDRHPPVFSLLSTCQGPPVALPDVVKTSDSLVVVYSGIFLNIKSQWELLNAIRPTKSELFASHLTLSFEPTLQHLDNLPIGKRIKIKASGEAENSKIQAALVDLPQRLKSDNKVPHITVSAAEGIPPKFANSMLQSQVVRRVESLVLEGTVGVVIRQATDEEVNGEEPPGEKLSCTPYYVLTSKHELRTIIPKLLHMESDKITTSHEVQRSGILTGEQKITKLFVFDFDGTLVNPPGPVEGKRVFEQETGKRWPHKGWLGWPESLLPPIRVLPGPALAEFRSHVNRAGSYTIVLTGRVENTRIGFLKVLENFQVFPQRVVFKPDITDESTAAFKLRTVKQMLLQEFPQVTSVKFWDDVPENLSAIQWLSQGPASHVQFDIIDATKMVSTCATKQGKKLATLKPQPHVNVSRLESVLQSHLANYGFLPTLEYQTAAQEGLEFIANQFSKVIQFQGNPLNLLYPFGSYPLQRVSDIDLCLIAPDTYSQIEWITKMASQLQTCGVKHVHVGHSARCPRLKILLQYSETPAIEFDIVIALVPDMDVFTNPTENQLLASKIAGMRKPGDSISKVALSGPLFMEKIEQVTADNITMECFGAVVEMIVQLLIAKREKGNAYHCIRTFHIVQLLIKFIESNVDSVRASPNYDDLFVLFVEYIALLDYENWEKLFGEFVPEAYIPQIIKVFKEASQVLKQEGHPSPYCYEQLLKRADFPPESYTPIDVKISGKNEVLKWKAGIIVEARLPSYIRQLLSHGLDIKSDGNVNNKTRFSFSVPPLKSAKDTLQQILRPFWSELADLRKHDGLTIQLNFGQPTMKTGSPSVDALSGIAGKDPKSAALVDQVTKFALSDDSSKELHLPSTLTSHARLFVHEVAERLGLQHSSVGNGRDRHVVLKKP